MKELRIPYASWKTVRGTLAVYYVEEAADPVQYLLAIIGKYDYLITCRVLGDDAADFETNYKATGIAASHVDEAIALGLVSDRGSLADLLTSGPTGLRPTSPQVGAQFYDATLSIPIWWNGSVWKDAAGNTV